MKLKLKITNTHFTKNVVTQLNSASDKFASSTDAITAALAKNTSISSVRQNNTQLLSLRELNLATVEGQTALAGINVKLDENNAFIKENVSSYEQQKIAIGAKTNQEAFQGINLFNGGIGGFVARASWVVLVTY
jgi:sulfur transfer complex TusBCD TusB component (DsrH family)